MQAGSDRLIGFGTFRHEKRERREKRLGVLGFSLGKSKITVKVLDGSFHW